MAFSFAPLLVHSEAVPVAVREALRAAGVADPEQREGKLQEAARALYRETDLECSDARELVGLPDGACS